MAKRRLVTRQQRRERRHLRVRKRVSGTPEQPRLVVFRSLKHMEGQVVDDTRSMTLIGVSTLAPELRSRKSDEQMPKLELSRAAGRILAERAREQGITKVVFDRGGYLYHGRVKAFADGAREGGLEF